MTVRAVFLDRDGTIIEDTGFVRDPASVRLLPGAAAAIARLNRAGWLAIVVTNQSGIARGLLSEEDYRRVARRVEELLAEEGAALDAQFFCPHLPELSGPCECRKPGAALFREAAERFDVDLGASWWVGDRERDVAPAELFGGRAVLLAPAAPAGGQGPERPLVRADLAGAVDVILADGSSAAQRRGERGEK